MIKRLGEEAWQQPWLRGLVTTLVPTFGQGEVVCSECYEVWSQPLARGLVLILVTEQSSAATVMGLLSLV